MSSILPDDERVRNIAREIFARDEFNPHTNWLMRKWQEFWHPFLEHWEQWLSDLLRNWTGTSWEPEIMKVIGYVSLAAGIIGLAAIIVIIWQQFKKRFNLTSTFKDSSAIQSSKKTLTRQAYDAAAKGDYALACTYLFRAVLAGLQQEGYVIPFNVRSTRWIILELERLHYPDLDILRKFCSDFNYICYCLDSPDESMWNALSKQGELLLKPGELL